ncbi:uncharacterized protein BT62DRAFT_905846, partial [Guyanagaster necrorhizus]
RFPFDSNSIEGMETPGQIASYPGATMMLQYRSHLFTILICGQFARFIRWDRTRAIVSMSFDYTNDPDLVSDFYK